MTNDRTLGVTTAAIGPLTASAVVEGSSPIVERLGEVSLNGPSGVVFNAASNDLRCNFVVLRSGDAIESPTNVEVDVLILIVSGSGVLVVDGQEYELGADVLAVVPAGCERKIKATSRLVYHSIHSSVRSSATEQ